MLTHDTIQKAIGDIQRTYVDFLRSNIAGWRVWAEASDRMLRGEEVLRDQIPAFFHTEYDWAKVILDKEQAGGFDWNDPGIAKMFTAAAQSPFYRLWGETITGIALRLARMAGAQTLIESGAGRANLTAIMLEQMAQHDVWMPLVITDAHEAVLEQRARLRRSYPSAPLTTYLWDINSAPSAALAGSISPPALLYERATITYANYTCIKHMAQVADILVLGDYFNYTGELFGYDTIFEKIGVKPLMFTDAEKILTDHFPNLYIIDKEEVTDTTGVPNISLVIAWK